MRPKSKGECCYEAGAENQTQLSSLLRSDAYSCVDDALRKHSCPGSVGSPEPRGHRSPEEEAGKWKAAVRPMIDEKARGSDRGRFHGPTTRLRARKDRVLADQRADGGRMLAWVAENVAAPSAP